MSPVEILGDWFTLKKSVALARVTFGGSGRSGTARFNIFSSSIPTANSGELSRNITTKKAVFLA